MKAYRNNNNAHIFLRSFFIEYSSFRLVSFSLNRSTSVLISFARLSLIFNVSNLVYPYDWAVRWTDFSVQIRKFKHLKLCFTEFHSKFMKYRYSNKYGFSHKKKKN